MEELDRQLKMEYQERQLLVLERIAVSLEKIEERLACMDADLINLEYWVKNNG